MIDAARWDEVKEILGRALELETDARREFLLRSTAGDLELEREVESLLAMEESMDDAFLGQPPFAAADVSLELPEWVGAYHILHRLGEGGMGTVLLAESRGPMERRVAVKVIHGGVFDSHARSRFEMECRALSRMNHSNIAQVYEAGVTEQGLSYIVMEYVAGVPVTTYCETARLDLRQRLELFLQIGDGIQHAHQAGILHRDVKPTNILVSADGVPKIIDFGIAKSLTAGDLGQTGRSESLMVGTLAYMSPEMLQGDETALGIDIRSDVYALGVLLYELLIGRNPFRRSDSGLVDIVELKTAEATPSPSALYGQLGPEQRRERAATRATTPRQLERDLRGDLDWIARKAVAQRREERYGTAADLVADVRRHLDDRPVQARPESRAYLARRFVRRHKLAVVAGALFLSSLVAGLTGMTVEARRANREASAAEEARVEAEQVAGFLVDLFENAGPKSSLGSPVTARELLDRGARGIELGLDDQPLVRARLMDTMGVVYLKLGLPSSADPLLEGALAERVRHRAPPHEIVRSLGHLADLYTDEARYEEAERMSRRALSLTRDEIENGEVYEVGSLNLLGRIARLRGHYDESERYLRQALEIGELRLGPDHAAVAASLKGLAVLYAHPGRLSEAEALFRRALAIGERRGGGDDLRVADTVDNLAVVLSMRGRVDEAEPLFRHALDIRERVLGEDHLAVATSLNNLGTLMSLHGRPAEAVPLYRRALAIKQERLEADHPEVAKALHNLGECLAASGDPRAAIPLLVRSLEIWDRRAPRGRNAAHTAHKLANVYRDLGRTREAGRLYERSLEIYAEANTPDASAPRREVEADYRRLRENHQGERVGGEPPE